MRMRYLVMILGLALLPAAASAQEGDAGARIDAAMRAAARAEIPLSLLESKVDEGHAKGIAEARIASAVEARLNALVRAHQALERGGARAIGAGELSIAADALQAGVSENAMVDVMTRTPTPRRVVATAVLTQLVELGVASDVALARVHAAIAQGGEALVNLPSQASDRARVRGQGGVRVNVGPPADVGPPVEIDAGVRGGVDLEANGRGRPDRGPIDGGIL